MLIQITPLITGDKFNSEAVIQHADLTKFAEALVEQRAVIETHLGIEVRKDVKAKPVQQLGSVLKLVGLRLERHQTLKQGGRKAYQYRLEPKSLARIRAIVEARKLQNNEKDFRDEEAGDN